MLPIKLVGGSLGARQKEFNNIIHGAQTWDPSFDSLQSTATDVDALFKIELASKLKNINYLMAVLSAGDSLHISRVLKQLWIYDIEYCDYVNCTYLQTEIFPFMSERMIRKTLNTIAVNIKDETRMCEFCDYCMNKNMKEIAYKFLIHTPECYKIAFLHHNDLKIDDSYFTLFVGDSFNVARACFNKIKVLSPTFLFQLYKVSELEFLDLIEKHLDREYNPNSKMIGQRLTKHIVKHHLDKVLEKPKLYLKCLHRKTVIRNISIENAKIICKGLYPNNVDDFWSDGYYEDNKDILEIIPFETRLKFIKENFKERYPGEAFEMSQEFYEAKMYDLMTKEQKEEWAWKHLNYSKFRISISENVWYKFIDFKTAFEKLKGLILISNDRDRRINFLGIMLEATKNQDDLEILLTYVHHRHVNERNLGDFVEKVIEKYEVFELNESCWSIFNIFLHVLKVYSVGVVYDRTSVNIRFAALVYHIAHELPLPASLEVFVLESFSSYYLKRFLPKLGSKKQIVYEVLVNIYIKRISKCDDQEYTDELKDALRSVLRTALSCLETFEIKLENYPSIIMKYAKLDIENFRHLFKKLSDSNWFTGDDLVRLLKKDVALLNEKIPLISKFLNGTLNKVLMKLKIYFHNDANIWISHFMNILNDRSCSYRSEVFISIHALLILATSEDKANLMQKYAPVNEKIDYVKIDGKFLHIQEALCRFAAYSRPPIPLNLLELYIKGDYVKYCQPMFGILSVNLTTADCMTFIKFLLEKPVSIQKHGIKFAFKRFSSTDLRKLVTDIWKQTKNKTLRLVLFVCLNNRIEGERNVDTQKELIGLLKVIMEGIKEDDDDAMFSYLDARKIALDFKADFLECAWHVVDKLPKDSANWPRKRAIILKITSMRQDFVYLLVKEYIDNSITKECLLAESHKPESDFKDDMWKLTTKFIATNKTETEVNRKLPFLTSILSKSLPIWNETVNNLYVVRRLIINFINEFCCKAFEVTLNEVNSANLNEMLTIILEEITNKLPISDVYLMIWTLKVNIVLQKVIHNYKNKFNGDKPNAEEDIREMIIVMGKVIGELMNEYVSKGQLYPAFIQYIQQIIQDVVLELRSSYCSQSNVATAFAIFFARGLIEVDIMESYMIALDILPADCPDDCQVDFHEVLNKIKCYNNEQLKCLIYLKFCNDYKKRKY